MKCLIENSKYSKYESGLRTYRNKLEEEVFNASEMIVGLIRQKCIGRDGNSAEDQVFFLKLAADHYRYMAEVAVPKLLALA